MTTIARTAALGLLMLAAVCSGGAAGTRAEGPRPLVFLGACYCRAAGILHCAADLTESDCRRRCDEALCDDWFWKERLPCWNWGYGG
jgi:hypothetical protein